MQPSGILQFLKRLARLVTGSKSSNTQVLAVARSAVPLVVRPVLEPAVAGFIQRAPAPAKNFYLAARLASVARLNTPMDRIPHHDMTRTTLSAAKPADRSPNATTARTSDHPIRCRTGNRVVSSTNIVILAEHVARRRTLRLTLAERITQAA